MKRFATALVIGGLAWMASPAYAVAGTTSSQQFTVVKLGSTPGTVIANGEITAVGIENNNRLQVPPGTPFQVTFAFPQGDLFQTVTPVGPPEIKFDSTTCVVETTLHTTTIVTGGTAALAGVSGSGVATTHRTSIVGRNNAGTCQAPNSPSIFELTVVRATGTVSIG